MGLEIMHVDMDAFFAAVEELDNPELKGKPIIVGGVNLNERGVVSTASYEARKYGVHSAMPITEAKRLCPHGIFLPGRHHRYSEVSRQIFAILERFTPAIEKISIDEAFLDLKGCHRLFGSSKEIGKKIKKAIKKETGITASIGLAPNKFLAKLASDLDKPDGFYIVKEGKISEVLDPLPVSKIWGVGKKTKKVLERKGIRYIKDLKQLSRNDLENLFGKMGIRLYNLARGIDQREVEPGDEVKSISHEETYPESLIDKKVILARLMRMAEKVTSRVRSQGFKGKIVFIKIRYDDYTTYTRRLTLIAPTNSAQELFETGKRLLEKDQLLTKPVRLLGIGLGGLTDDQKTQLSLFSDRVKEEKLAQTIDRLRNKFGEKTIYRARNLDQK